MAVQAKYTWRLSAHFVMPGHMIEGAKCDAHPIVHVLLVYCSCTHPARRINNWAALSHAFVLRS